MSNIIKTCLLLTGIFFFVSCRDSKKEENEDIRLGDYTESQNNHLYKKIEEAGDAGDNRDDLSNKGIGPVELLDLDENIDERMASTGADLFDNMCSVPLVIEWTGS